MSLIIFRKPMHVLNAFYISGIGFIGSQALLSADLEKAFLVTLFVFFVYLGVVSFASFVSNAIFGDSTSDLVSFKKGIVITGITTAGVFPSALTTSYIVTGGLGSSKFYFYTTIMSLVVFATTGVYGMSIDDSLFKKIKKLKPEVAKTFFDFYVELFKILAWTFVFVLLGTAFSGVLTGTTIGTGEMILIFYTTVGMICLATVPLIKDLYDVWEKIME